MASRKKTPTIKDRLRDKLGRLPKRTPEEIAERKAKGLRYNPYRKSKHKKGMITDRQRAAIDEYFRNGFRKVRAAEAAGFSHPYVAATRIFSSPAVIAEIERRRKVLDIKSMVTKDRVIEEYRKIAFSNLGDLMVTRADGSVTLELADMNDDERAAVSEFVVDEYTDGKGANARPVRKTKIKFHSKQAALDSIARHLGMFNDKITLEAEQAVVNALLAGRQRVRKVARTGGEDSEPSDVSGTADKG